MKLHDVVVVVDLLTTERCQYFVGSSKLSHSSAASRFAAGIHEIKNQVATAEVLHGRTWAVVQLEFPQEGDVCDCDS